MFSHTDINTGAELFRSTPGAVLLDVRTPEEYREGHIPGSPLLPLSEIGDAERDGVDKRLDTRTPREYSAGHAEGFVNIPVDELRGRLGELAPGKPVYVMCQSGLRSYLSCCILSQSGFDCSNFSGGYRFYAAVIREKAVGAHTWPCGMEK